MKKTNTLFLCADEHARRGLGCYGNSFVQTPHLDKLAQRSVRFTNAYASSPLCAPTRACIATGRYTHETRYWDNGHPYDGRILGWNHHLTGSGHCVTAIGKLHYRKIGEDNGFTEEIIPMHSRYGRGDHFGLIRKNPPSYGKVPQGLAKELGPGETTLTKYDRLIGNKACDWLKNEAPNYKDKPWVLFVSFVTPHFPLIAPPEFYNLYTLEDVPLPTLYSSEERPTHPVIKALCKSWNYDDFFDEEKIRLACTSYYALCSFVDYNIGRVLTTLEECGLADDTRVIYTSDHGEMLGDRGIWSTAVMYEESVGVPLMISGPDIPENEVNDTIVSHVDLYKTIIESAGESLTIEEEKLPGHSLIDIANGTKPERTVLSQYHSGGSITGFFMIRQGRWKYIHYVGYRPQLFDLVSDPFETNELGESNQHTDVLKQCEAALRKIVNPEKVNAQAFTDQQRLLEEVGGAEAVINRGYQGEHALDREDITEYTKGLKY